MNKSALLQTIVQNVRKKHPWKISQEKFILIFGELPKEYLNERLYYDNLLGKSKQFKSCHLVLTETKIEIRLTLDQCIVWELSRWEEAQAHNILPSDIKKMIKEYEAV